ncbi:MAG: DRTGG domain-containing protein [bacterium]
MKDKFGLEYTVQGDNEVVNGYASDLLSVVMGRVKPQSVWLTVQTHKNIVAVAKMADISAIIICDGFTADDDTVEAAVRENIPILKTEKGTFEIAGMLYESGIK